LPLVALGFTRAYRDRSAAAALFSGACLALMAYTDYYYLVYGFAFIALTAWVQAARVSRTPLAADWKRTRGALLVLLACDALIIVLIIASGGLDIRFFGTTITANRVTNPLTAAWLMLALYLFLLRPFRVEVRVSRTAARRVGLAGGLAVLVFAVLASPVIRGGARLLTSGAYVEPRHQWRSGPAGIDVAALVLPPPLHPLWGRVGRGSFSALGLDRVEGTGWLGVVPILLTFLAWKERHSAPSRRLWVCVGTCFFVWSLGPWLKVGGWNTGLILPQNVLSLLPIVGNARIPGRGLVMVFLAIAMMSASYLARSGRRIGPLLPVAALLVAVDFWPSPYPVVSAAVSPVYSSLRELPGGIVCELPFGLRDGFGQVGGQRDLSSLAQTVHEHPVLGGFVARLPRAVGRFYESNLALRTLLQLSDGTAAAGAGDPPNATTVLSELKRLGVRYVVIDREHAPAALVAYAARWQLQAHTTDGQTELYLLD
jgi:hypothetical protein